MDSALSVSHSCFEIEIGDRGDWVEEESGKVTSLSCEVDLGVAGEEGRGEEAGAGDDVKESDVFVFSGVATRKVTLERRRGFDAEMFFKEEAESGEEEGAVEGEDEAEVAAIEGEDLGR